MEDTLKKINEINNLKNEIQSQLETIDPYNNFKIALIKGIVHWEKIKGGSSGQGFSQLIFNNLEKIMGFWNKGKGSVKMDLQQDQII